MSDLESEPSGLSSLLEELGVNGWFKSSYKFSDLVKYDEGLPCPIMRSESRNISRETFSLEMCLYDTLIFWPRQLIGILDSNEKYTLAF